jgi:hypothetical protein
MGGPLDSVLQDLSNYSTRPIMRTPARGEISRVIERLASISMLLLHTRGHWHPARRQTRRSTGPAEDGTKHNKTPPLLTTSPQTTPPAGLSELPGIIAARIIPKANCQAGRLGRAKSHARGCRKGEIVRPTSDFS